MLTNDVSQLTNGDALPANVVTVPLTNVGSMLANDSQCFPTLIHCQTNDDPLLTNIHVVTGSSSSLVLVQC